MTYHFFEPVMTYTHLVNFSILRNKLDQVYECYYSSTEHFVSIGSRILKDLCTVQLGAPGSAQVGDGRHEWCPHH